MNLFTIPIFVQAFLLLPTFCFADSTTAILSHPKVDSSSATTLDLDSLQTNKQSFDSSSSDTLVETTHDTTQAIPNRNISLAEKKQKALKDSIYQDSIQKVHLKDSLGIIAHQYFHQYEHHTTNHDSIFDNYFDRSELYSSDGMGLSEGLRNIASFYQVPYTFSSRKNRLFVAGIPYPLIEVYNTSEHIKILNTWKSGLDNISISQMSHLQFCYPSSFHFSSEPQRILSPETNFLWEGGQGAVFDQNILDLRFARPLSQNISIGIFSHHRLINRTKFNHTKGGINGFYRSIYRSLHIDTSLVAHEGINPKTKEQVGSIYLKWFPSTTGEVIANFEYSDFHNDHLRYTQEPESTYFKLQEVSDYNHHAALSINDILFSGLNLDGSLTLESKVDRLNNLDSRQEKKGERGEEFQWSLFFNPEKRFNYDTVGIFAKLNYSRHLRFNRDNLYQHYSKITIEHDHQFSLLPFKTIFSWQAGWTFVSLNNRAKHNIVWQTLLNVENQGFLNTSLNLFAKQQATPNPIPHDTIFTINSSADRSLVVGGSIKNSYKLIGLDLTASMLKGYDSLFNAYQWVNGITPFEIPPWELSITPTFGKWHGMSLSSSAIFSPRKPILRSKTVFSYQSLFRKTRGQFFLNLTYEYWSLRNNKETNIFIHPIMDLHLNMAVQIKTFRIFYKAENLFNRRNMYIPGYIMPGLIFRWGINWFLPG